MDSFQFQQLAKPKQLAWIGGHTHKSRVRADAGVVVIVAAMRLGAFEA